MRKLWNQEKFCFVLDQRFALFLKFIFLYGCACMCLQRPEPPAARFNTNHETSDVGAGNGTHPSLRAASALLLSHLSPGCSYRGATGGKQKHLSAALVFTLLL